MLPLHALAGALTGFVVGLTGVGGGALMTPLLLLWFGMAPLAAVGTDLWFAALTKLSITRLHHRHGLIDWPVARCLWAGSLPAAAGTGVALRLLGAPRGGGRAVAAFIATAVVLTALGLLVQALLRPPQAAPAPHPEPLSLGKRAQTAVAGVALGILVTLTSVGAGALGAVFLAHLHPRRLSAASLVATDIVHAIPLALVAGASHLLAGTVDLKVLASLLAGSIPAALLGVWVSQRIAPGKLRIALGLVLLVVGWRLWRAWP